jgi:hypothetical protein
MYGSYPASLRNVDGSCHVPAEIIYKREPKGFFNHIKAEKTTKTENRHKMMI